MPVRRLVDNLPRIARDAETAARCLNLLETDCECTPGAVIHDSRSFIREATPGAGIIGTLAASGLLVLLGAARDGAAGAPQSVARSRYGGSARAAAARKLADASSLRRAPVPWDDGTYRATVVVRRGTSQGSGTIIASVEGETLVLTAAHVVKAEGPI